MLVGERVSISMGRGLVLVRRGGGLVRSEG